jgi:hypothetical protein
MSSYNNFRFTPGNKANLRLFINRQIIKQFYNITGEDQCSLGCLQTKSNLIKQGYNDPSQTENTRISQILTGTLGGKTMFGNFNRPVDINYLGGWEGQPGGSFRPPRNKF